MTDLKRRNFLKISAVTAAMLAGQNYLLANILNYKKSNYTRKMYENEFKFIYGLKKEHGYADSFEVWTNNGTVTRENQKANYPLINPNIPDFNPRGANTSAQHSQVMYEKDRLLYPMKRVGERGAGVWERVNWDNATQEIAQNIWEVMSNPTSGPQNLMIQMGKSLLGQGRRSSALRFSNQLGAVKNCYKSDFNKNSLILENGIKHKLDTVYGAEIIVIWGYNPSVTNIPDAHFIQEARYNGAKIIVITPDYNASAKSADLWIPLKARSDNVLAMGVIHEILQHNWQKKEFMKEFTDFPFLVKVDDKQLLRKQDLQDVISEEKDEFYVWDKEKNLAVLVKDLKDSSNLELSGEYEVTLLNGNKKKVTTVFEMLKKSAQTYSFEKMKDVVGVHPDIVKKLARYISLGKIVKIITGDSLFKYTLGAMSAWSINSISGLLGITNNDDESGTSEEFKTLSDFDGKYNSRTSCDNKKNKNNSWNPEMAIVVSSSLFRKDPLIYKEEFLAKVKYFVCIDTRMSETALNADILLPAKDKYETWDIESLNTNYDFINMSQPTQNLLSIAETKGEWSIFSLIAKKIENISNKAENINLSKIIDSAKYAKSGFHDLSNFYKEFTNTDDASVLAKKAPLGTDKMAVDAVLENYKQNSIKIATNPLKIKISSRRKTFYKNLEIFLNTNVQTKQISTNDGVKYSYNFILSKSRWSINSNYQTSKILLRLQRGVPYIEINYEDASSKNIKDGNEIRIFNEKGEFYAMAKVSHCVAPKSVIMHNGWESYMFRNKKGYNEVMETHKHSIVDFEKVKEKA